MGGGVDADAVRVNCGMAEVAADGMSSRCGTIPVRCLLGSGLVKVVWNCGHEAAAICLAMVVGGKTGITSLSVSDKSDTQHVWIQFPVKVSDSKYW